MNRNIIITYLISLFGLVLNAQINESDNFKSFYEPNTSEVPGFFSESLSRGYNFAILQEFDVTENFKITLQGTYKRLNANALILPAGGSFRFDFLGKYYFTDKLYGFAGPATELFFSETTGEITPQNFSAQFGIGYDVTESFFLQIQQGVLLKELNKTAVPGSNLPTLTSGFRF